MKKNLFVFPVILFLMIGLLLAGCDGESKDPGGEDPIDNPDVTLIDYTVTAATGELNVEDTTMLRFAFTKDGANHNVPAGGLAVGDITVTDDTGSVNVVSLSTPAGPNRQLTITVNEQGNVKVKITKEGFVTEEKTVMVYKRLGFEENPDASISDVVTFGTPIKGPNVTFASNLGATIAILPPRTDDPVSVINAATPALDQVIATFDPPFVMLDSEGSFRWFDMVWDNFGSVWEFENESGGSSYTGREWHLHQVQFQLDLTTTTGARIRFQKTSETNTSNAENKNPVRFEKADIQTGTGNTAWGTGHTITAVTLRVTSIQLRSPQNSSWVAISADRAPWFVDMWISKLSAEISVPPPPKVLYSTANGWLAEVKNPSASLADIGNPPVIDLTEDPMPSLATAGDGSQLIIYWDEIDIRPQDTGHYTTIVVSFTGGSPGWYGHGSIFMDGANPRKNMAWDGANGNPTNGFRIPLNGASYFYNPEKFIGFFVQFNAVFTINITEIRLE